MIRLVTQHGRKSEEHNLLMKAKETEARLWSENVPCVSLDGADDSVQGTARTSLLLAKDTVKVARVIFAPMPRLTVVL